jgi:FkbM family methyltransferase
MVLLKIGNMTKYFIDCGAHCGESILMAKQRFGESTTTISFEPVPYLAKQLQEIHEGDKSIFIQNSAVWIEDTTKKFFISDMYTDGSSLLTSLNGLKEDQYVEISCFDFSSWLKNTFSKDEEWIEVKKMSEEQAGGPLLASQHSLTLKSLPFSPNR